MFYYFVLYKPFEVLSQFSPEGNKKTLKDCMDVPEDVYPVGRLDFDSEGLLILTNDSSLNASLLLPRRAHERTYFVQVEGEVTMDALHQLEQGVLISSNGKKFTTLPTKAKLLASPPQLPERHPPIRYRKNIPTSWISLTLTEGKNRQVRKMTAAVGFPTLRLVRHSMGQLNISGWQSGELRQFNRKELFSKLG
ncbi:pseudouridine synthase [Flavihumibacter fluvii]|uniref:pseudouridine synthase n=1 Tax=Flavihumibacter fluvii TaxID=2838157 RepID=UPI001EFC0F67|nr:pseudouridine synthase [Flavihumibacter fluvii]ULQ52289.1 pseudouridine synthase [Flavihumibacter fluvii]